MFRKFLWMNRVYVRAFSQRPRPRHSEEECIISCRRNKLNHYPTTTYDKFTEISLASKGWDHNKSKGDFFTINPSKPLNDKDFVPFESLNLPQTVIDALNKQRIMKATPFQAKTLNLFSDDKHLMLSAETGCGKTYAYLLPIIQRLLQGEPNKGLNSPRVLILAPNRELVYQIGDAASNLAQGTDLKVKVLVGGGIKKLMLNPEMGDVDILVGSPGVIGKLSTVGIYRLDKVLFTVLDEADTLLDDSFLDRLPGILNRVGHSKLTFVSATLLTKLPEFLEGIEPSLIKLTSENLHRPLVNITQKFLRILRSNKPSLLLDLAKHNKKPMIIFSNRNKTSDWIALFLRENNVPCSNINGDMAYPLRVDEWNKFVRGDNLILSATDVGSRGLDTVQVEHVLNYDFPLYAADYLHRVGRVGRLGGATTCRATNFVSGHEEIRLVQQIELAVRRGEPLGNVDGNITRIVQKKIRKGIRENV